MASITYSSFIFSFLKRNWFQVSLGILVLYAILKKDLSFSVNLESPPPIEQTVKQKREKVMTDLFTENNAKNDKLNILPGEPSGFSNNLSTISEDDKVKYLKRFAHVAISEKEKFNIPASVILASALLHSRAGTSDFSKNGFNQFSIKCGNDWSGQRKLIEGNCLRKYKSAWLSFRDHSQYITSGKFEALQRLGSKEYKKWSKGLEELNFSNEKNLSNQLISIIEKYKLYEID